MEVQEFRDTGHRMVDLLGDYFESIEDRPLFPDVEPQRLTELFDEPLPGRPATADDVLGELMALPKHECRLVAGPATKG